MSWLWDMALLRPLWLLALPVLVVLAVMVTRRRAALGDWSDRIDPQLLRAMDAIGRIKRGRGSRAGFAPFIAAGLICMALTGPSQPRGQGQTFRNLDGVVFVLDVSRSMTGAASWPGVITMARAGLSVLGSKPGALIVFAGDTYDAAPLTTDAVQLGQTIALLDGDTVPDPGSRPALALTRAAEVLEGSDILAGDVVLATDGDGLGPEALRSAARIAALGGRLLVVHAPTDVAVPPTRLAALARAGGGAVFAVNQTSELMRALSQNGATRLEAQDLNLLFWTDYGRYLLLLALIPVAGLFRREMT